MDPTEGRPQIAVLQRRIGRRSKFEPVKKVALNHLLGLLNYFTRPITNAGSEAFNTKVQAIEAEPRVFLTASLPRACVAACPTTR